MPSACHDGREVKSFYGGSGRLVRRFVHHLIEPGRGQCSEGGGGRESGSGLLLSLVMVCSSVLGIPCGLF